MKEDVDELRERAERIARGKLGFQIHLVIYIGVNSILIFLWYLIASLGGISVWTFMDLSDGSRFPWFLIPILGWGIGLFIHFITAYMGGGHLESVEKREYEKLKKLRKI